MKKFSEKRMENIVQEAAGEAAAGVRSVSENGSLPEGLVSSVADKVEQLVADELWNWYCLGQPR